MARFVGLNFNLSFSLQIGVISFLLTMLTNICLYLEQKEICNMRSCFLRFLVIPVFMLLLVIGANGQDQLSQIPQKIPNPFGNKSGTGVGNLTQGEIANGLKEALSKGTSRSVDELGKEGGYLKNLRVKIPMPSPLKPIEKTLRVIRQDKVADDFIKAMNTAAEKAVPVAASVFADAIKEMTIEDAKNILTGPNDSATQYFKKTSEAQLIEKFLPIVKKATEAAGVTAAYKKLTASAGPISSLGSNKLDIDNYVTQKALDGLFLLIADEEKSIRENPLARTSDILKKVFGKH